MTPQLSLTDALDMLRRLEAQLTEEQAKRAALEVENGSLMGERIRFIFALRLCREHIINGKNVVQGELLQELLYFDRTSGELLKEAQKSYANYLATYVEPMLMKEVETSDRQFVEDSKWLPRLVFAGCIAALVLAYWIGKT